jgi:hypothetical protein
MTLLLGVSLFQPLFTPWPGLLCIHSLANGHPKIVAGNVAKKAVFAKYSF